MNLKTPEKELTSEELEEKIEKLMKFFDDAGISYDKYDPNTLPKVITDFGKKAFPNYDSYISTSPQHDISKWLQAIKDIYYKEKNGLDRKSAIRQATSGWKITETFDFLNWLKFYEEGSHMKYKKAQVWYENGNPGYFLHIKQDPKAEDVDNLITGKDIDFARDSIADEMSNSEKKRIIEKQRHKIIGRLDSAEKLLRTPEGQLFAGKELESLMETIYSLKKKIQLVNKISASTRLYEDMIIREANILHKKGFIKAASHLSSLAQDIPNPTPPAAPNESSGAPGGLPSMGPGTPQTPPDSANETGVSKFLDNLDTGNITTKEDKDSNDILEVHDENVLEVNDDEPELLVVEAQELPKAPGPKVPPPAEPPATENPLEVKENELGDKPGANKPNPQAKNFDNIIDSALANVTVQDVIDKLEDLAKIFKTREIPRQLSIVDLMLDSLNLGSFFPSLSEATNKALDSNNYISTRVDDILAKLRGSVENTNIDLRGNSPEKPEVAALKNKLQQDEDKEKARKQQRKEQQDAELDNQAKETPEIDIAGDLSPTPPTQPKLPTV